ncbi:MAG: UDP-N-acetylmuramoyl-tripeptide--D-alanyl-D-alanine ligase [Actinomycetota bacterium]|nr:UDP-N-acetylmuramoyl-tripeptide--D-alanyl-D-alanine ligase [Actinomycetota bacterium]
MFELSPEQIAQAAGAEIVARGGDGHPGRAIVDSRQAGPGDLFVGLRGEHADGGAFAEATLAAGAWGALVGTEHAAGLQGGWVLAAPDPLAALASLAREWRRQLGARVVGVTGSVGKTSVKDICATLLPGRVHASPENYNTEIGLPLTVLAAPAGADVLVLEMAMRGAGQIAELAAIAEPDVAVITNVGPVHVELLGSVEAIAAVKAEILAGLPPDGAAVVPVDADVLEPYLEGVPKLIRFGDGGDVDVLERAVGDTGTEALVSTPAGEQRFSFPFTEDYNLTNALAAISAGIAIGVSPAEMSGQASSIRFSRLRGERVELGDGVVLVNDSYNANPVSMRAALDHLGSLRVDGRRIAVLGEMAELGSEAPGHHREVGAHAREAGVDLLVGVGEAARDYAPDQLVADSTEAAELLAPLLGSGDTVLVKGSRAAGLELVAETLPALLEVERVEG